MLHESYREANSKKLMHQLPKKRRSRKFARGFGRWHHAYDGKGYPPLREAGARRRRDHALHDHAPHPVDKGNDSEGFDRGCRIQVASLADRVSGKEIVMSSSST